MRNAFAAEITALAQQDERVVLLSGDIGNRLFDEFKERAPQRFYNCGVAEANMMSMAAGLALSGMRPVAYTITPFITTRCYEQIRVDVCYHNVPVIIVGTGSGLSYAANGATHHSLEDIALMRMLPHMAVMCPGDPWEVRGALRAALQHDGPVYIRIGKKGERKVHTGVPVMTIGRALQVKPGSDVCLLATGNLLAMGLDAASALERLGLSTRVCSFHTVKPLDESCLQHAFESCRVVVTLEEHSRNGGLGGSVAEWLADQRFFGSRLLRIGTPDEFLHMAGEQEYARECFGLTVESIVSRVATAYQTASASSSSQKLPALAR